MALALDKRVGNTVGLPFRVAGTGVYGGLDAVNTAVTLPKQSMEIISNTTQQIKDVLAKGRGEKKWYHRLWKAPLSTIMATGAAVEGAGRAILNPLRNTTLHTRDVLGNFLVNPGNAIKSVLSDKPVSEFKYEHLKTREVNKKNWIAGLFLGKKDKESKGDKGEKPAPVADKKDDTPKGPSENEIKLQKENEALKKQLTDISKQTEAINKENEALKKQMDEMKKQLEETKKQVREALSQKERKDDKKEAKPEDKKDGNAKPDNEKKDKPQNKEEKKDGNSETKKPGEDGEKKDKDEKPTDQKNQ